MARAWDFALILDRTLERHELTAFDEYGEDLGDPANGSLTPTSSGPNPSQVYCLTPGASLLDAVTTAAAAIRKHTGARAVRIEVDEEHRESLDGLARVTA
ncbi:hypothetical protein JJV70_07290 [Streptomyces sp. JJ66]|uniref:hypothetical protein n=1 Tax=Streptomyces sp. JJ66 TaxID=2803843 RepID=UPI001C56FFB3|nr:hypothetical protein [Streptomyces sp. JJ66]MBW1601917.1 hypothetical protein [Streptomyces sp. JJ66]